jgi:hypothetical protein
MYADIHVSSGNRTHDPSVWAGEDSSCLRPRGHYDRDYYKCCGWKEISVFSKQLQIQTRNNFKTARKLVKFSLATLIVTYQTRVALQSPSKESGVSNEKCTILLVVPQEEIGETGPLDPGPYSMRLLPVGICDVTGTPTSDAAVPTRAYLAGHSQSCCVRGKNSNIPSIFAE